MRVLVLVHEDLVPPSTFDGMTDEEINEVRTEDDVVVALEELGHEVKVLGLYDELAPLRRALDDFDPHVVFNLLEEFHGSPVFDYHVVAYLELMKVAYTGCNSRGLLIARDKALSKKILQYHRIRVPRFGTCALGERFRRPKTLRFPLIVKSQIFESSSGLTTESVVRDDEALAERITLMHESLGTDVIVEEYVEGREIYAAVLGDRRMKVMPLWELHLDGLPEDAPRFATDQVKWDIDFQERHRIRISRAQGLTPQLEEAVARNTRRICKRLGLDGYVRVDFRLAPDGEVYFLEANPNPDIAEAEEFASAAEAGGLPYHDLLSRILDQARRRAKRRARSLDGTGVVE